MNDLVIENNSISYTDADGKQLLIDENDYISNISRIPVHGGEEVLTASDIITQLSNAHTTLLSGTYEGDMMPYYVVIDSLVANYFSKHSGGQTPPLKVAEMGCDNGIMSYHLATLMGLYDPASLLTGITNSIGNESNNSWLDMISLVENPSNVSFIATDYDSTNLSGEGYDIVIINGSVKFDEPFGVIKEAERIVKENGLLIVYAQKQPLLESTFSLFFEERKEYYFLQDTKVMARVK